MLGLCIACVQMCNVCKQPIHPETINVRVIGGSRTETETQALARLAMGLCPCCNTLLEVPTTKQLWKRWLALDKRRKRAKV